MPVSFPFVNPSSSQPDVTSHTRRKMEPRLHSLTSVKPLITLLLVALWGGSMEAGLRLHVDLSEKTLQAIVDDQIVETYTVAIGNDQYPTPKGDFTIGKLIWNPSWKPPDSKWAKNKTAKPPGHPENPMKRVKLFFRQPDYYIHGTGDHDSLGTAASHGCIRMSEDDVTELGRLVMEHGGEPKPEPWYRRILRGRSSKAVYLSDPIPLVIE
jgi:murein L,D-transpeptidase YcbB/YkuD